MDSTLWNVSVECFGGMFGYLAVVVEEGPELIESVGSQAERVQKRLGKANREWLGWKH